jgi:hypothetical protein
MSGRMDAGKKPRKPKRVPGNVDYGDLLPIPEDIQQWILRWHYRKPVSIGDAVAADAGGKVAAKQNATPEPDDDSTSESDDDEAGPIKWTVVLLDDGEPGYKEETVLPESLPDTLWILSWTGGKVEEVPKKEINPDGYAHNGKMFLRMAKAPEALNRYHANPPKPDDSSSELPAVAVVFRPAPDPTYRHKYDEGQEPPSTLPKIFSHEELQGEYYFRKVTGKVFCGEPDPENVLQGIGNCYFMASLASIAATDQGKKFLKDKLKSLCGDTDQTTDWVPAMTTKDGEELFACGNRGKKIGDENAALWPVILEKDFANKKKGGYNAIVGGTGDNAFAELGLNAETLRPRGKPTKFIKAWLEQHTDCALVLGTPFGWGKSETGFTEARDQWEVREIGLPLNVSDLNGFQLVLTGKTKKLTATANEKGEIRIDGNGAVIGNILSKDNKPPGEDPNWSGEQIKLIDKKLSTAISCGFTFEFEKEESLSPRHQYAIKKVESDGLVLWDTDAGREVILEFDKVGKSVASITAGKFGK